MSQSVTLIEFLLGRDPSKPRLYYLRTPPAMKIPYASGSSATRPEFAEHHEPNSSCVQANRDTNTAFEADQDLSGTAK